MHLLRFEIIEVFWKWKHKGWDHNSAHWSNICKTFLASKKKLCDLASNGSTIPFYCREISSQRTTGTSPSKHKSPRIRICNFWFSTRKGYQLQIFWIFEKYSRKKSWCFHMFLRSGSNSCSFPYTIHLFESLWCNIAPEICRAALTKGNACDDTRRLACGCACLEAVDMPIRRKDSAGKVQMKI